MINIYNVKTIIKKELRNYLDNPASYIVMIVFLLLWEFLFFRNVFLVQEASVRMLYDVLPWLFMLLVPAVTMGSVSQEKTEGTLELLLTHPLKDLEFLLGKFIASLILPAIALLFTLPISLSLQPFGQMDWGMVFGQILSGLFLASAIASLGIFISSLVSSQIASLLVTVAGTFFLTIVGSDLITASIPLSLIPILERLSLSSHFSSMTRGVIDTRDIWYFISFCIIFLSLAYLQMLKRKYGNRKDYFRSFQTGVFLFIGIAVLTNIIGERIPGRIDLTSERIYTLSDATKKTLNNVKDVVNITLYASSKLPAQFQPVLRDTKDMLRDYQTSAKGNIIFTTKDPSQNPELAQDAQAQGIREVQFNVIGNEEFQLKTGYLGLAISYAGQKESIPFIQTTSDLEYQLTSNIKKLTTTNKKKISFTSGNGEKSLYQDYQKFSQELGKLYTTDSVALNDEKTIVASDTAVLVLAGPNTKFSGHGINEVKDFLNKGGSAMFLINGTTIDPQSLTASANTNNFSDFVKDLGVDVGQDIVYDTKANETIRFGGGIINYYLPYPFWIRAVPVDKNSIITSKIEGLVMPWASSVTLNENKLKENNFKSSKLIITTKYGGKQTGNFTINPNSPPSNENLGEQLLAVSLSTDKNSSGSANRIIVVGDSDFLTDQFLQNAPENLTFGMNAFAWLSQEESLAGIPTRQAGSRKLMIENATQTGLIKYGNFAIAALIPAAIGFTRLLRRRNLRKLNYTM